MVVVTKQVAATFAAHSTALYVATLTKPTRLTHKGPRYLHRHMEAPRTHGNEEESRNPWIEHEQALEYMYSQSAQRKRSK